MKINMAAIIAHILQEAQTQETHMQDLTKENMKLKHALNRHCPLQSSLVDAFASTPPGPSPNFEVDEKLAEDIPMVQYDQQRKDTTAELERANLKLKSLERQKTHHDKKISELRSCLHEYKEALQTSQGALWQELELRATRAAMYRKFQSNYQRMK